MAKAINHSITDERVIAIMRDLAEARKIARTRSKQRDRSAGRACAKPFVRTDNSWRAVASWQSFVNSYELDD